MTPTPDMTAIRDAIVAGDTSLPRLAALGVPDSYRGITVHKDEVDMFKGLEPRDKDPRKSLHLDDVAVPELGPGEALVAVMASSINYNTVWTSLFEPVSTFGFLEKYGRMSPLSKRHDLPYHVVGSDASGVVLATGSGSTPGSPATRSSPTACRSSWSAPTATTTRCWTRSSGSGASRPTSVGWPSSHWSRPTS
jgi:crotonyl-CoA reductase